MIAPQNRLVFFIGFTFLPMSLVAAALPAAIPVLGGTCLTIVVVCLLDALHVARRCGGVSAEFPQKVNLVRNRNETLDFRVNDERAKVSNLQIALALPPEITSSRKEFVASLPRDRAGVTIRWPVHAVRRGKYPFSRCYFQVPSRLGLWFKRGRIEVSTRICVYPDLTADRRKIAALFLQRGGAGWPGHQQIGQGRDFEQLRDYLPGDVMGDIHWRVTAKRGRLVTKEYQLERTQEIYVLVDASRLSSQYVESDAHGGGREHLLESYITASLSLGDFARSQGDRFGLIAFSDRVLGFLRAAGSRGHFQACREALFNLHPQTVTPDFEELAVLLMKNLRRRALLVFLTSLSDPSLAESFLSSMQAVRRRHLVVVNMMRPPLAAPLFSDSHVAELSDIYTRLGGHLLWQNLRELEVALSRRGIEFALVNHGKLCVEMVSRYMNVKRRQVL